MIIAVRKPTNCGTCAQPFYPLQHTQVWFCAPFVVWWESNDLEDVSSMTQRTRNNAW